MSDAFNAIVAPVPLARQGGPGRGVLSGLRIGVKDNIAVAGVRSTCASAFFVDDHPADRDADVVAALKRAGARITGTLNMAEFAVGVTSQNSVFGGPINPWNAARVPGGSSGGSGVAVAAGLVDAALGTDTGGSIRLPASCCGVVGLRPTAGSVSGVGVFPVSPDFDTVGPLARTVDDVRRVFEVLAGVDATPERARRIAAPSPFVTADVDPAIAAALGDVVRLLGEIGYEIGDSPVPLADTAQDVVYTLIYSDLARIHADRLAEAPERFHGATFERISLGRAITADQRAAAIGDRDRFRAAMDDYFAAVDVVLTPTMPVDVPVVSDDPSVLPISRRMGQLSYPWSLHAGPTLSVPVGFHPESGMPIGAQLTAAPGREALLFDVAGAIQSRTDWHLRRPPGVA
ncbi:amidase [Gordonia humi]|uniref:Aspartyl-tRNA(Asn)/glutamyl-tRNA(Gln) amidotransferase subunit A n=1 Tax=Gordonia humi TaxID=686429 RepID=A0A840EZV8_9ACTN|nr:amidase [Gordonia humi]MBB4133660.1 aspartyl-tRNA(Asn)/glutamyl-tRNA(Gln) amidotransferase subunit A [Gordonia humi]